MLLAHILQDEYENSDLSMSSCIELGAGTGVCGIAIAHLFAKMTLTDLPLMMKTLRENVALNSVAYGACKIDIMTIDWYNPLDKTLLNSFDLVVASECIYEGIIALRALLQTSLALLKKGGHLCVLSAFHRDGVQILSRILETQQCWHVITQRHVDKEGKDSNREDCDYIYIKATRI